ncbi:MAG: hypothetical protein JSS02_08205 [Planctomycetes bacterium]|nr:hypothetical protein [Planctomycetota bacterium]
MGRRVAASHHHRFDTTGVVMKYYFLALATVVTVCVGCTSGGGNRLSSRSGSARLSEFDNEGVVARGNMDHGHRGNYVMPPASMMVASGPGVDGPGPGVMNCLGMDSAHSMAGRTTQIKFVEPEGMSIGWQIAGGYADNQVAVPGRFSFHQAAAYRLKVSNIPGREGLTLYPTLQVYPAHPQTEAYLAHSCVPLQITDEDLDQIQANNFVTKVIYLPSPQHQELAIAGVETLVSTRLDPGLDPVAEADRRGTILAVFRCGNMDMESPEHNSMVTPDGTIRQTSAIRQVDGEKGEIVAPLPIGGMGGYGNNIPPAMMMGGPGGFGQPPVNPIMGGTAQGWGMPITGTPIGLAGPAHLPLGTPAGLKSHTVRNKTKTRIPDPVDHMVIDVKQKPGINVPAPVKHIEYEESQPSFRQW